MNDTQPVPQVQEPSLLPAVMTDQAIAILERLGQDTKRYRTNLPLEEAWAKTWFLKLGGIPNWRLENQVDQEFQLAYYHAKIVPVTLSETGEIVPRVMVTLFNPEGKTLAWTSEITTSKFGDVLAAHGLGPWDPPIKLTVKAVKAKGGVGNWHYFETPILPRPAKRKG